MALFSKPPTKKPEPPKAAARPPSPEAPARSVSARELAANAGQARPGFDRRPQDPAAGDITVSGASMIEWTPAQAAFEVSQANPGLCPVLENAALMYASGQVKPARSVLEEGLESDHETRHSPLAWLSLFDLLQRAGERAEFEQLALKYVVQFERSAPAWDEHSKQAAGARSTSAGYVGITGKLTAAMAPQFEAMKRALGKPDAQIRLDLMSVTGFDDDGARLLTAALAAARHGKCVLLLQRIEKLKPMLEAAVRKGREAGEAAWMLSLEMLQWANDREAFEDRAVEYAVAFELSPPSWEPPDLPEPPKSAEVVAGADATGDGTEGVRIRADTEMVVWSGAMTGSMASQLTKIAEFATGRNVIPVDMTLVERVDFVCAGSLLNMITRIETQRKAVQIVGATPIIRALLLLIGISPRHFVKKAQ
jgi:anti-anti-sigma regulatory factor